MPLYSEKSKYEPVGHMSLNKDERFVLVAIMYFCVNVSDFWIFWKVGTWRTYELHYEQTVTTSRTFRCFKNKTRQLVGHFDILKV